VTLRLEYRESCVATLQLSLCFAKPINKPVCNSPLAVRTSGVDFSISAEGDNFVFLAIPAGSVAFVCRSDVLYIQIPNLISKGVLRATLITLCFVLAGYLHINILKFVAGHARYCSSVCFH